MIKFKDFYVSDSDYEEQMELFQNEHPNAEFIQITGGHMSPERIWFKYDDKLKEQSKLSIPKKIAELLDISNGDWGNVEIEELDYWIFPNIPDGKESYRSALCEVYLAGKALGVELVEVTDE